MVVRKLLVKIFRQVNATLDIWIDNLMYLKELRSWEKEKSKEGFPKEWFEEEE